MARTIQIVPSDPEWPAIFEREAARIRTILGGRALRIEHVGSTSVAGLAAKPVIDILLVVVDSSLEESYVPLLEAASYPLRIREPDWFQHRLFKGPGADINLHVFSEGCPEIDGMLQFRDWLRANPTDRERYQRIKLQLAEKEWGTIDDYANAKTAVVEEILSSARRTNPAQDPPQR